MNTIFIRFMLLWHGTKTDPANSSFQESRLIFRNTDTPMSDIPNSKTATQKDLDKSVDRQMRDLGERVEDIRTSMANIYQQAFS